MLIPNYVLLLGGEDGDPHDLFWDADPLMFSFYVLLLGGEYGDPHDLFWDPFGMLIS